MTESAATGVFLLTLSGIPITFFVNTVQSLHGEKGLLISGVVSLTTLIVLTYMLVKGKKQASDPLFYVFTFGSFASVVDLIIALENEGVIHGFMSNYLQDGEPYLKTAYGTLVCLWDGTGHYAMYIFMLAALSWNESFREIGLYWAGSIGHSMLVFIPGNIVGKYGLKLSFLLNIPYMIIPFSSTARFLRERPREVLPLDAVPRFHVGLRKRPVDVLLMFGLLFCAAVTCLRGFAVMGCSLEPFQQYVSHVEPYLSDPVAYPKCQMLVYLYYFLPYYVLACCGLLWPENDWMPDWSLIHAGAAINAQFAHIGGSLHYRTPYTFRVPRDSHARTVFWTVNLVLLILPQIMAYRCVMHPEFFQKSVRRMRRLSSRQNSVKDE